MGSFHASLPILESLLNGGKVSFQRRFFGLDKRVHYTQAIVDAQTPGRTVVQGGFKGVHSQRLRAIIRAARGFSERV
jgi:hypothetical protein